MVSGIGGVGSTPVINYTPDPGEPAVRLSAPQEQTAYLVHAQEQRNETRLRARALADGEDVLFSKKTFNLNVGELSPVYSSGLTTVVSRPDQNGFLPDQAPALTPEQQKAKEEEESPADEARVEEEEEPTGLEALQAAEAESEEELEEEEQDLENEDSRLERNLMQATVEKERALEQGNMVDFQNAQREARQLEREQEELEKEERENELDKLETRMRAFQENTDEILNENLQAATGLLDVMFGFGKESANSANAPAA